MVWGPYCFAHDSWNTPPGNKIFFQDRASSIFETSKKNKFKPGNNMKLGTSVRRTGKAAKRLKIGTRGLEIEAKEEDCITADAKSIPLLRASHVMASSTAIW